MNEARKKINEIFSNFTNEQAGKSYVAQQFADYLIRHIRSGCLPPGTKFPSREHIHFITNLPYNKIDEAFSILRMNGCLKIGLGTPTEVIASEFTTLSTEKSIFKVHADFHCTPTNFMTATVEKKFSNLKGYHHEQINPKEEYTASRVFCTYLARTFNKTHDLTYQPENFYYANSYYLLMRAVGKSICGKKGVIVISRNANAALRDALNYQSIKIMEVDSDDQGIDTVQLAEICGHHQVCGVFIMSASNMPDCVTTSVPRLRSLLDLQQQYSFKIVDYNLMEPWLENQCSKLLNLAADPLQSIIYIYPINYTFKELNPDRAVAADAGLIKNIEAHLIAAEDVAQRSVAEAANQIFLSPQYKQMVADLQRHRREAVKMIREVFNATGYWSKSGINQDSGMAIFLKPLHGMFPPGTVEYLQGLGISVYDSSSYNGSCRGGIRMDFTHHIGSHRLKDLVVWVESVCRQFCEEYNRKKSR